jgi:imidazole glycerol-phosphate synthase subunit HisF
MSENIELRRIIPSLLLKGGGLVKTTNFKKPVYIGDPVNAVKIFNEKEVDELIILGIDCTPLNQQPDYSFIQEIVGEAFMPICYGGGIKNIKEINMILYSGVEKVAINTTSFYHPEIISEAAKIFGSQAIVASIDIGINWKGKKSVFIESGRKNTKYDPVEYAKKMQDLGAGELLINCIYKDGTMTGYDIELIKTISNAVSIPVIALGGAKDIKDLRSVILYADVSAASAGSMFVYTGIHKAVLINYSNKI